MELKYKCKYCNKIISIKDGVCSSCKSKLVLVRKLLRMVKTAAGKEDGDNG